MVSSVAIQRRHGPQCSPKHNAFDSSGFLCRDDPPLPFLPRQGQAMENACESAQTERAIHPRSTKKPMFHPRHVTCSRIHQGWILKTITKKKSPKKPINRMCPCEESTDERIKGQPLGQGRLMVQGILPG